MRYSKFILRSHNLFGLLSKDYQLKIETKFSLLQVYKTCSKLNDILHIVSILTKL